MKPVDSEAAEWPQFEADGNLTHTEENEGISKRTWDMKMPFQSDCEVCTSSSEVTSKNTLYSTSMPGPSHQSRPF